MHVASGDLLRDHETIAISTKTQQRQCIELDLPQSSPKFSSLLN